MRTSMRSGAARQSLAQRLFPRDDVASLDSKWRIFEVDAAGEMHPERDQLVSGPADVPDVVLRRGTDFLREAELVIQPIEPIARPRERHDRRQFHDIAHIEPDVHETAAVAAERAHFPDGDAWTFVEAPERLTIEASFGIDAQRRATEGDQRRNGRVDVDDGRPVQRQLHALIVFVLLHEAERLTRSNHQGGQRKAGALPESHNPK